MKAGFSNMIIGSQAKASLNVLRVDTQCTILGIIPDSRSSKPQHNWFAQKKTESLVFFIKTWQIDKPKVPEQTKKSTYLKKE